MQSVFFEIGFIVVLATFLGAISRRFRQPLFLAYLATGMIVKALGLNVLSDGETLSILAEFGIAFLLFIVGLELNPKEIKEMGKPALIIGGGEVLAVTVLGIILGRFLGFSPTAAVYLGLALSFSSTIIVVKLLSEKGEINALYGRISVGILLFQDLVAIVALILLSSFGSGGNIIRLVLTIIKTLVFLLILRLVARDFLPAFFKRLSVDGELLFVGSIAWCLVLAGAAKLMGFSLEIGAFLGGLTLAATSFRFQIGAKIKPLRNFFILIFFVVLGLEANFAHLSQLLLPTALCVLVVLILKPIIIMALIGSQGYRKRSGFLAGLYLSQISEFSLVLVAWGASVGHLNKDQVSLITLVAILSIIISSLFISKDRKLYEKLRHPLSFLEREKVRKERIKVSPEYIDHVILIGCHRMGIDFWHALKENNIPFVVLDFDPKIIKNLEKEDVPCIFGDMGDPEILELLNLAKAKMVISTVADLHDNLELLEIVGKINPGLVTILTASQISEALKLYQQGANYVILPHLLGGHIVADLLEKHWQDLGKLNESRAAHIKELLERKELGYEG